MDITVTDKKTTETKERIQLQKEDKNVYVILLILFLIN